MPTTPDNYEDMGERSSITEKIGRGMRGLLEEEDAVGPASELPPPGLESPPNEGTVENWLRTLASQMRDEFEDSIEKKVERNPIPVLLTGVALGIGSVILALAVLLVVRHLL